MESNQELFSLQLDPASKNYLNETAKWGRFLAIVGFIGCGLVLLVGLFFGSLFGRLAGSANYGTDTPFVAGYASGFMLVIYVLIALLYFFPCLFLLRFANKTRTALAADNQAELTDAFQNLKSLFKFVGILTIVVLSFYVIGILIAVIGFATRF